MDSTEEDDCMSEKSSDDEEQKPTLVDASVQLDLIEDYSAETEVITVESVPGTFTNIDMKLPIPIQNCLPLNTMQVSSELFVITNNGISFLNEQKVPITPIHAIDVNEPLRKRLCFEQNGQTYIVAVQDGLDGLASIVELAEKNPTALEAQIIGPHESLATKYGINQNWFTSRADKTSLHNQGHVWKQGMWSKEEIDLLESNIQQYCEEREVTNASTVIFEMSKDERKDFYRTVAKGLNRPLFSVYRRVIRMYDKKNYVGKYTPEELNKLRDLRSTYGNDWQVIGAAMGRSASSIKDRCRLMRDHCNHGKWLASEEKLLADTVYELTNCVPGEMISSGLSWAVVAERVKTRSEKQCRAKWLNFLNWKEAGGTEWTKEDDVTLICRVCAMNATDEGQVDWSELSKGWSSVRSPQWLRGKWWTMKRHVPNAATFPDVCESLYQYFVLKEHEETALSSPCSPEESIVIPQPQIITHPKPTIIQSVIPAAPTASIVVTQACPTPVVSLTASNTIDLESSFSPVRFPPVLQTLEVLPASVQLPTNPPTYIATSASQQSIQIPQNQIIIHTVPAESLHTHESVSVMHIDHSEELEICSSPSPMTSLASTQIPSAPPSPIAEDVVLDEAQPLVNDEQYETEVIEENADIQVSGSDEDEEHHCKNRLTSHIILADPMIAGHRSPSRNIQHSKSTETMNQASSTEGLSSMK